MVSREEGWNLFLTGHLSGWIKLLCFCSSVVKASEVSARYAVIAWKTTFVYHSYRIIYHVAGEETRVNDISSSQTLEPSHWHSRLKGMYFCAHALGGNLGRSRHRAQADRPPAHVTLHCTRPRGEKRTIYICRHNRIPHR